MRYDRWGLALLMFAVGSLSGCSGGKPSEPATPNGATASGGGGTSAAGGVGNTSEDAKITSEAQAKIDADATLKAAGVQAKATGAQVELTGTVQSVAEHDKAETAVWEALKPYAKLNAGVVNNIMIAEPGASAASSKP